MRETLRAGVAQREITPPAGKLMAAFPDWHPVMKARVAEGAHDPLWARALALSDGTTTVVVCVADVGGWTWLDVDHIRAAFAEETGLVPENLILSATHNHNGPECSYVFGGSPDDPYIADLRRMTAGVAVDAVDNLAPAKVGAASVEVDLAFNRRYISPTGAFRQMPATAERKRQGPVDPRVSVLRLDGVDDTPLAGVIHFAAHPVIMTNPNRLFTASYPGAAVQAFESLTEVPTAMFWQGAAGDTHPYEAITDDYGNVQRMGNAVAEAAAEACALCETTNSSAFAVNRWQAMVPYRHDASRTVRIEATAIRLSDRLALVFWPGEPFIELSLALQWRSPFARTIVVGYSSGHIGYVGNRNAYEYGGYGVELQTAHPNKARCTSVMPGFGERLVNETARLLEELRDTP
jgi:neutral ceramidase